MFIGRTDAEAETPIFCPPHVNNWLIGKDPDAGRDWGQEEKGMTEDEMAGWHHRLDGHEFGWTPGFGVGQGGLVCCDSWGCKESDANERLIWAELNMSWSSLIHSSDISNLFFKAHSMKFSFQILKFSIIIHLFCNFLIFSSFVQISSSVYSLWNSHNSYLKSMSGSCNVWVILGSDRQWLPLLATF